MPFSRSEDYLFLNQDSGLFKHPNDYKINRIRPNTTTTSVSATNSPLLPQRNSGETQFNRMNAGSSLSIARTNTSGSLHSVSSDESTAAVVSLPVTTPFRSNVAGTTVGTVQHSASLMSLAKPKIPETVSLNALTEISNIKRSNNSVNIMSSGSILSGNIIPVNINQKPLKTTANIPETTILNQHISSSSMSTFSKHSGHNLTGLSVNVNTMPGMTQKIQSPVKSPIIAVSPIDTVLSGTQINKRTNPSLPIDSLATDLDLLQCPPFSLESGNSNYGSSVGHNLLGTTNALSDMKKSESVVVPSGFTTSGSTISTALEIEEDPEDLENGVKMPTLSSGVLQAR